MVTWQFSKSDHIIMQGIFLCPLVIILKTSQDHSNESAISFNIRPSLYQQACGIADINQRSQVYKFE